MKIYAILFFSVVLISAAHANTYIYKPLDRIPKAEEVIAFTNGKRPPVGERKFVTKEEIMHFLSHGTPIAERKSWISTDRSLSEFKDGVFFDSSGRAYFWDLRARNVLILETANGESIQIILKE